MDAGDRAAPVTSAGRLLARTRTRMLHALRSARVRETIAGALALAICTVLVRFLPFFDPLGLTDEAPARGDVALLLFAVFLSVYTAAYALVTHLVLRTLPRPVLLATVATSLDEDLTAFQRLLRGRTTTLGTSIQMLITAGIVVTLLITRPDGISPLALMGLTVFAVAAAWACSAVGYAMEYARADRDGTGFEMTGCPEPERRGWDEYLYLAVLIQTSSAPADFSPLTRQARRAIRRQAVLAHITATVLLAVAVSALTTAL